MGIAAYNRGSKSISNQIDAEQRRPEFEIMERLNRLPKGKLKLSAPIVIRVTEGGEWWIMNRADRGWAEFGFCYPSARSLFAAWDIHVTGCGSDQYSAYYTVK